MYKGIDFVAHFEEIKPEKLEEMMAATSLLSSDKLIDKICPDIYRLGMFMEQARSEQKRKRKLKERFEGKRARKQREKGK